MRFPYPIHGIELWHGQLHLIVKMSHHKFLLVPIPNQDKAMELVNAPDEKLWVGQDFRITTLATILGLDKFDEELLIQRYQQGLLHPKTLERQSVSINRPFAGLRPA